MTLLFLKGLAFGFVLAATVGPMWVLCLRRTLAYGALTGLASGMGIAVADGFYGAVAAFGLTAISGFLLAHSFWIGLVGGVFLVYLGVKTLLSRPAMDGETAKPASLPAAFLSTLGLTLANPPTILAFAAIFAGLGLAASADYAAAALITLAVFLGSAAWWIVLASSAGALRGRLGPRLMRAINIVSGITILGFAFLALMPVAHAAPSVEETHERLAARDFAALEASLGSLRGSYRPEVAVELEIWNAFRAFGLPGARTEDLEAWLEAFPSSYDARLAAAIHYEGLAWRARGTAFAAKTPPARFADSRGQFTIAMQLAQASLELTAQPVFSHVLMINVARNLSGAGDAEQHYAEALKAQPLSFLVRSQQLGALQPKWGGSFEAMDELIRQAGEAGLPQASLKRLGAFRLAYMATQDEDQGNDRQALAQAEQSVALQETAFAQVIRGRLLRKLGNESAAQQAFEAAVRIDSYDRYAHNNLAQGYALAGQHARALESYQRSAMAGNEWSANYAGLLLLKGGGGVRRDPREAARWFVLGAQLGSADAMHNLGECYRAGDCGPDIKRDDALALDWFHRAEAYGSESGSLAVAAMLWDGTGVARDDSEAVRRWIQAVGSEDAEVRRVARRNLAHLVDLTRSIPALTRATGYPPFAYAMLAAMALFPLLTLVLAVRDGVMTLTRREPGAARPRIVAARGWLWLAAWAIPLLAGVALWVAHVLGLTGDFRIALALFVLACAPTLMILYGVAMGEWKVVLTGDGLRYTSAGEARELAWHDVAAATQEGGRIRLVLRSKQVHVLDSGPFGKTLWREISARLKT
jgi:threonine/homoserine/homoserine lactone efflux protein/TPR repeat protein